MRAEINASHRETYFHLMFDLQELVKKRKYSFILTSFGLFHGFGPFEL